MIIMQSAFGQKNLLQKIIKNHPKNEFILLEPLDETKDHQLITFNDKKIFNNPLKYNVMDLIGQKKLINEYYQKKEKGFFSFVYFDLDEKWMEKFLTLINELLIQSNNKTYKELQLLFVLKLQTKIANKYSLLSIWANKLKYDYWHKYIYMPIFNEFLQTVSKIRSYHEINYQNIKN